MMMIKAVYDHVLFWSSFSSSSWIIHCGSCISSKVGNSICFFVFVYLIFHSPSHHLEKEFDDLMSWKSTERIDALFI